MNQMRRGEEVATLDATERKARRRFRLAGGGGGGCEMAAEGEGRGWASSCWSVDKVGIGDGLGGTVRLELGSY